MRILGQNWAVSLGERSSNLGSEHMVYQYPRFRRLTDRLAEIAHTPINPRRTAMVMVDVVLIITGMVVIGFVVTYLVMKFW